MELLWKRVYLILLLNVSRNIDVAGKVNQCGTYKTFYKFP